jgi:hypothetical protein
VIYDLSLNRDGQITIADDTFLNEFMKEVEYLTTEEDTLVYFSGGRSSTKEATGGTTAFNAFTYYINQQNANTFGFIDPLPVEPDETTTVKHEVGTMPSFKTLEQLFLEKAKLWLTSLRSGTTNFYVSQAGRRPLYTPRHKTYRRPRSKKTRKQ